MPAAEVARLLTERSAQQPIVAGSARNRFPGVITEIKRDKLSATVEIQAGPHRVLAFITREAVDQLGLEVGHGGSRHREGDQRDGQPGRASGSSARRQLSIAQSPDIHIPWPL